MIRVRVDDFPHTKGEPQHTLAAYREFDRCLRECLGGKRYLLGVIPHRSSVDDILYLRNETDCTVGMHGIRHDEHELDLYQNEFPPYLSQKDVGTMLMSTVAHLDDALGRDVRIYMPPRNRIDRRTVDVLLDCGFYGYTTGPETPAELRMHDYLTVYHSEPPHQYGRSDEMLKRNSQVHLRAEDEAILTLHWTWETNIGLNHLRDFLGQIPKDLFVDFDG
jgi:hypothetical protein